MPAEHVFNELRGDLRTHDAKINASVVRSSGTVLRTQRRTERSAADIALPLQTLQHRASLHSERVPRDRTLWIRTDGAEGVNAAGGTNRTSRTPDVCENPRGTLFNHRCPAWL